MELLSFIAQKLHNIVILLQYNKKNKYYAVLHFLMSRNAYTLFQSRPPPFSDAGSAPDVINCSLNTKVYFYIKINQHFGGVTRQIIVFSAFSVKTGTFKNIFVLKLSFLLFLAIFLNKINNCLGFHHPGANRVQHLK